MTDARVIVCGAGSAGSTVAGRLAEDPDVSVLLLEAGPDDDRENVRIPELWPTNLGTEATWNRLAEPSDALDGRAIPYFMGRGLGGGGSVNVTVWSRGHERDWNSYAAIAGDDAWDYAHVLDVYRGIESYRGRPDARRGTAGPIPVDQLSVDHPFHAAVEAAANAAGFPSTAGLNGELMESSHGTAARDANVRDGQRVSPYRAYVHPRRDQPNLTVIEGATVAEILFDGDRATGVRLTDGREFTASEQVVLALGAIGTPEVLMRSGIGDAARLRELGIAVRHDAPAVGAGLHDHVLIPVVWSAVEDADLPSPFRTLNGVMWNLADDTRLATVLYVDPIVFTSETTAQRHPLPERGATLFTGIRLRSRGRVSLASADPGIPPVIEHGYFSDPTDLTAVVDIVREASRIGDAEPLQPYLEARALPPADATDAALADYVREAASTFWHQCGTAAMGASPSAVVDSRLRVNGVEGLRVVDASVLPHAPVGNTMAPAVVVGEQAARFIRDDLARRPR